MSWLPNLFAKNIPDTGPEGQPRNTRQKKQLRNLLGQLEKETEKARSDNQTAHIASIASFKRLEALNRQLRKDLMGDDPKRKSRKKK